MDGFAPRRVLTQSQKAARKWSNETSRPNRSDGGFYFHRHVFRILRLFVLNDFLLFICYIKLSCHNFHFVSEYLVYLSLLVFICVVLFSLIQTVFSSR